MKSNKKKELLHNIKIGSIAELFLSLINVPFIFAQTTNLEGEWVIEQVKIKKTVNSVVSENTYSISESFDMFAECIGKITFTSDNQVIVERKGKSADEEPNTGTYTVEGNKITRMIPEMNKEYKYEITETNEIQLLYSFDYFYNHGQNRIDKITEECTFYGTKK